MYSLFPTFSSFTFLCSSHLFFFCCYYYYYYFSFFFFFIFWFLEGYKEIVKSFSFSPFPFCFYFYFFHFISFFFLIVFLISAIFPQHPWSTTLTFTANASMHQSTHETPCSAICSNVGTMYEVASQKGSKP